MPPLSLASVIPTRGRPEMLLEALESVRRQTRQPDEVIVSDNHGQPAVDTSRVRRIFPEARIVRPSESLPVDQHWLWALRQAKSDWACLLEDDNWWRSGHLRAVEEAIAAHASASIVFTGAVEAAARVAPVQRVPHAVAIPFDLVEQAPVFFAPADALATLLVGSCAASSAVAVRRTALHDPQVETLDLTASHDRWLWARVASLGGCAMSPELTMVYRLHSEQMIRHLARERFRSEARRVSAEILNVLGTLGDPVESLRKIRPLFGAEDWIERGGRLAYLLDRRQWERVAGAWETCGMFGWIRMRGVHIRKKLGERLRNALT